MSSEITAQATSMQRGSYLKIAAPLARRGTLHFQHGGRGGRRGHGAFNLKTSVTSVCSPSSVLKVPGAAIDARCYKFLSAMAGSTRVARRPGMQAAAQAMTARSAATE